MEVHNFWYIMCSSTKEPPNGDHAMNDGMDGMHGGKKHKRDMDDWIQVNILGRSENSFCFISGKKYPVVIDRTT